MKRLFLFLWCLAVLQTNAAFLTPECSHPMPISPEDEEYLLTRVKSRIEMAASSGAWPQNIQNLRLDCPHEIYEGKI